MKRGRKRTVDPTESEWGWRTLTVRVSDRQLSMLKDIADSEGVSVGVLVRRNLFSPTNDFVGE